ncbi:hypothetical protein TcG_13207 [Trypanosoma cruzi]|nr:hypothetical protein TcG_13207 [Trypanosoma cruzi]
MATKKYPPETVKKSPRRHFRSWSLQVAAICEGVVDHRSKSAARNGPETVRGFIQHVVGARGQAKSLGWSRQAHTAGKADPFPGHQEPKECSEQQQQQCKVTWHVKAAQNDGQADLPVAEAGRIRGPKISAEHHRFQRMRVRHRHAVKISPPRAG